MLKELAKRFKGKLSRCEVYDANVCATRTVADRPWELIAVTGQPFLHRLRFPCGRRKVTVLASETYVHGSASGTFGSRPFTINAKQRVFRSEFAQSLLLGGARYPVFTEDGSVSAEQTDLLSRPELMALIARSSLREGESLYFTKGEMGFYLKRTDTDRISGVIDVLVKLADRVETLEQRPDLKVLPSQFHPLIPLIQRWALADDSERQDLLEAASATTLRALVDDVSPYFEAIDSYLDSFGKKAPTYEAVTLGRLAEGALEARRRLDEPSCGPQKI
jgi:hypothetical protein